MVEGVSGKTFHSNRDSLFHTKRIHGVNKSVFYAIADGLFAVLSRCKQGIADMLTKKPKPMQHSMFTDVGFGWC